MIKFISKLFIIQYRNLKILETNELCWQIMLLDSQKIYIDHYMLLWKIDIMIGDIYYEILSILF